MFFSFLFLLLFILKTTAQSQTFKTEWKLVYDSLTRKCYEVEIQNLASENKNFDLEFLFSNTNFPLNKISDVEIYEWKALPKQFPVYVTEEKCDYQVIGNDTLGNPIIDLVCWNETVQNGTVTKNVCDWKPTKMNLVLEQGKAKTDYGLINIPKFGSKPKYDDFGNLETENGIKRFKICFNTPIVRTEQGWGSIGKIWLKDALGQYEDEDPWWNSTWLLRRNITINNTLNSNTLTDYQVAINLTYDSDMQPDFSDIRFTWYNSTSGTETEIPYWIESKVNSQWAYVWVKVPYIPASSYATIYVYYKNSTVVNSASDIQTTFIFGDDFNSGVINTSKWIYATGNYQILDNALAVNNTNVGGGSSGYRGLRSAVTFNSGTIVEARIKLANSFAEFAFNYVDEANLHVFIAHPVSTTNNIYLGKDVNNVWSTTCVNSIPLTNTSFYNIRAITYPNNNINVTFYNSSWSWSCAPSGWNEFSTFRINPGSESTSNTFYDDIRVRKYTSPEPTYSIGTEETYYQPPQFIGLYVYPSSPQTYGISNIIFAAFWQERSFPIDKKWIQHNFSGIMKNYTMGQSYILDFVPSAGRFSYTFYANDTFGLVGSSPTFTYEIIQANPFLNIFSNCLSCLEGLNATISCSGDYPFPPNITVNATPISNPGNYTLKIGLQIINCSIPDTQNYTNTSITSNLWGIYLSPFNATFPTKTLNFSILDEEISTQLSGFNSTIVTINAWTDKNLGTRTYTFNTDQISIYPSWAEINATIQATFSKENYRVTTYYPFSQTNLNNQTKTITLRMIPSSVSSPITFKLPDQNYIVVVERLYNNDYLFVRSMISDFVKNAVVFLRPYDTFYRIYVYRPDYSLCFASSGFLISSSEYQVYCTEEIKIAPITWYKENVNISCSFDNSTKKLTCDFVSLDGADHNVTLEVYKYVKPFGKVFYANDSKVGVSGSVSATLEDGYLYEYVLSAHSSYEFFIGFLNLTTAILSVEALWFAALGFCASATIGFINPLAGIALTIFLVLAFSALGLLNYTTGGIAGIIILFGLALLFIREFK